MTWQDEDLKMACGCGIDIQKHDKDKATMLGV